MAGGWLTCAIRESPGHDIGKPYNCVSVCATTEIITVFSPQPGHRILEKLEIIELVI